MRDRGRLSVWWRVAVAAVMLAVLLMSCAPEAVVPTETMGVETPTDPTLTAPPEVTAEPADLMTYRNEQYGFSLRYPEEWDVMEGRNFLSLSQGSVNLVVGYRHRTEDPNVCCREHLPEGELVDAGVVECAGEEIDKALLRCGDKTRAVMYEGSEEVAVGDLRFLFYVEDFNVDSDAADIPRYVVNEVDGVIGSLETFDVTNDFAAVTPMATQLPDVPEPTPVDPTPEPESDDAGSAVAEAGPGGAVVRRGPGPSYEIVGVLPAGEEAEITGQYINWWRIDYEGRVAWVYDEVVRTMDTGLVPLVRPEWTPEPAPETPTPALTTPVAETPTPGRGIAEAQPGGANVRSGPGLRYAVEGFLEGGERVEITGRHAGWWEIEYEGSPGWVHSGVVRVRGTEHVPEVVTVPTPVPRSPAVIPTAAPPEEIDEERWIDVSLSEQRLRAYEDGEVVRSTLVSTGLPETPTPPGQFRIWIKLRYDDMSGPGYHLENVPYVMYYYRGYGLHGTYWHDNFGQPMSAGCVNLPTEEAAWVYDFVDVGTLVNVRP